jgi:HTH-type transcriptional regulator / antitoxin HigA
MTVGIKSSNDRYLELMLAFPPRPIGCDDDLTRMQQQVNRILDGGLVGKPERDYLKLLGLLIYDYEERNEPAFEMTEADRALAMLQEDLG